MTLGAFAVVIALGRRGQANENLDDYAGAGFRSPFLGLAIGAGIDRNGPYRKALAVAIPIGFDQFGRRVARPEGDSQQA